MKVVVAEDEKLLRDDLVRMLERDFPEVDIVAACEDGAEALEAIADHAPDVAFLDIRMPGLTGLEVAQAAADASPATRVVFITAYNQYAIDAFDRGAVDYLLKPVAPDRLASTMARLKSRAANPGQLTAILDQLRAHLPKPAPSALQWITASTGKETRLILIDDVAYFQADNKYTIVMTAEGESLVRTPIRELLAQLDSAQFKQIHRSTIVNMKAVTSVTRDDSGRGTLRLKNRTETLPVSLTFMGLFRNM